MRKVLCILLLGLIVVGCYRSKGYSISCNHPDGRSYMVTEAAGLSKSEYKDIKERYEKNGYICE